MADSIGPHFLVTAVTCRACRLPVLWIERGRIGPLGIEAAPQVADQLNLSSLPERLDITPHACHACHAGQASQAVADATTSGEVGQWSRGRPPARADHATGDRDRDHSRAWEVPDDGR
jgi:hypothetical protein